MSRNLVICFDGTNNEFGPENTNVVRLLQSLLRDSSKQLLYYDPGVGTLPEPGAMTKITKRLSEIWGLAFGAGLSWKVQEAYSWLMDTWETGDQVFLFGFSRGAYSARVLAGLLHALGLMAHGSSNMVPYAMKLFRAIRKQNDPRAANADPRAVNADPHAANAAADSRIAEYWKLCDDFRWTFARPAGDADDQRHFPTHFLGVWDTVSSVGWVWDPASYQFTARNPSVKNARHAISIDEHRAFFRSNRLLPVTGQDMEQRWFPGVHSDVGGGYKLLFSDPPPVHSRLWLRPFQWLLKEAEGKGLVIDQARLTKVLADCPTAGNCWADPQHESLTGAWWIAEWFPKLRYSSQTKRRRPHLNRARHREILAGERIDQWALLRIRDTNYAPPNLSASFCNMVRALPADQIPDFLLYAP